MLRKTSLVVAALALLVLVPQAQAAKGDFMVGLSFGYAANENMSIGVDGSFTANDGSDDLNSLLTAVATDLGPDGEPGTSDDGSTTIPVTGKFNLLQGRAHAKYM